MGKVKLVTTVDGKAVVKGFEEAHAEKLLALKNSKWAKEEKANAKPVRSTADSKAD